MIALDPGLRLKPTPDVLDGYLANTPVAHALFRTAEAAQLANVDLPRPVLDLGCGAGQFAALALESGIEDGLDNSPEQLRKARLTHRYRRLHCGDARNLPFADEQFRSVLSISVLEHIDDIEAVIAEVFRTLHPGGYFVATVVLSDLHAHLFFPKVFRRLALPALGRCYVRWHDRLFGHQTLLSKAAWDTLLIHAGFDLCLSKKVVTPALTRWWDVLLLTAWPYRLLTRVGYTGVWHPRWFNALVTKVFRGLLFNEETEGSTLLFVAQKPPADAPELSSGPCRLRELTPGLST